MNTPSYYSILTANVRYDKRLSDFEKILYSDITALTNKNGYCTASNSYFANVFGKTKETISRRISHLQKLGYIEAKLIADEKGNIVERRIYLLTKISIPIDKNVNRGIDKNIKGVLTKTSIYNNTSNNNTSNNIIKENTKEKKFNFKKELLNLGIDPDLVDDWLLIRKRKKAVNTKTAFKAIKNQIEKTENEFNLTKNQILEIVVSNDWKGFKADWIKNLFEKEKKGAGGQKKEKVNTKYLSGIKYE
jgi:DNA-binding transcriptional ArsR family regulator